MSFLSLDGAAAPPETIDDVGYAVAWSADAASLLYVRVDDAWRPFELWRHDLWTDATEDVLVYREEDERFRVSVSRSRDDAVLLVHVASALTTEVHVLDAISPKAIEVLWPRRHGVECTIEHLTAPGGSRWWVATTNDGGATDFKVLAARVDAAPLSFRELPVAEQPGRRVNGVDAFGSSLVVSERRDGSAAVRLLPLLDGPDPFGEDLEGRGVVVGSDEVGHHGARLLPGLRHRRRCASCRPPSCPRSAPSTSRSTAVRGRCASARSSAVATTRRGSRPRGSG